MACTDIVERRSSRARACLAVLLAACRDGTSGPDIAPPLVLRVTTPTDSLFWGRSMQARLSVPGDTVPIVATEVAWRSADTSVAVVDSTGMILAVGVGTTTVTADYRAVRASLPVRGVLARADGGVVFTAGSRNEAQMCALAAGAVYCRAQPTGADSTPRFVRKPGAAGLTFTSVDGGLHAVCALERLGQVHCWGTNARFIFGRRGVIATDTGPYPVPAPVRFARISHGGHSQTCGIAQTDSVTYCWGHNDAYQLMHDKLHVEDTVIAPVSGDLRAIDVSTANFSTCLLDPSGLPYCAGWLNTARSSLGVGDESIAAEIGLPVVTSQRFASLAIGERHQCALTANGAAYCWGVNDLGQLGNGSFVTALPSFPAPVVGGIAFRMLHPVYTSGVCGISTSNELYCWGKFSPAAVHARLGARAAQPTLLLRGVKFRDLTEDYGALCGITIDGKALCW